MEVSHTAHSLNGFEAGKSLDPSTLILIGLLTVQRSHYPDGVISVRRVFTTLSSAVHTNTAEHVLSLVSRI